MRITLEEIHSKEQLEKILEDLKNPLHDDAGNADFHAVHLEWLKCPKCEKGHIVLKKGAYGLFGGCSNFPKCRGTLDYKKVVYETIKREGFKLYEWRTSCWRCGKNITMYSYFPTLDNTDLRKVIDLDDCRLGVIRQIDLYLMQKYNSIQMRYSKKGDITYVANVCTNSGCGVIQGYNYKLEDMWKWLKAMSDAERQEHIVNTIPVGDIMSYEEFISLIN